VPVCPNQRYAALRALDRWLRAHFARDEHELPLLKAIKGAILAGKLPKSGECRIIRDYAHGL
jgi:hypothetical protein